MSHTPMGPIGLTVRRASEEDWSSLRELRLRALREDPRAFGGALGTKLAYPDDRWRYLAEQGAHSPSFSTWVAADSAGDLQGMIVVALAGEYADLLGLWVAPGARHHGVGGTLLDCAIGWVRETHPDTMVRLEVNPRQIDAIRLYQERGFQWSGPARPLGYSLGEVVREMRLPLHPAPRDLSEDRSRAGAEQARSRPRPP